MRPSTGRVVDRLLDLDAQLTGRVGLGRAGDAAHLAREGDGTAAAGEPHALGDARDGADLGELRAMARDEQNALVITDVHGQGHIHGREDDGVVQRDE